MKLVKKWLFPVLTFLLVAGAALLPQRISQARDARQFGAVHTETMAADSLTVQDREPPSLTDRIDLYVRWLGLQEAIPSYRTPAPLSEEEASELAAAALDMLVQAYVLPPWVLQNEKTGSPNMPKVDYCYNILIWDPEKSVAQQEPYAIWELSADLGGSSGSVASMTLDAETCLPLFIDYYDPNIDIWMPPEIPDFLIEASEFFLDLLGLEGEPVILTHPDASNCAYRVKGTDYYYRFDYILNHLQISPEPEKWAVNYIDAYDTAFSAPRQSIVP